jgi:hypothetical protein
MLTESFQTIVAAARQSLKNWRSMILLAALYASLLATLYFFVTVREASADQVVLTLLLAMLAPILLFVLLTASASQTRDLGPVLLLKDSLKNSWKVVLVSVPLIVLALFAVYLLGKAQTYFGADSSGLSNLAEHRMGMQDSGADTPRWNLIALTTIRYFLIGTVLPIVAIHLWIASVREDLLPAIRKMKELVVRALSPDSVLMYMAGFMVFGLIPYLLLFSAIPAKKVWLEIGLFAGRIVATFLLS